MATNTKSEQFRRTPRATKNAVTNPLAQVRHAAGQVQEKFAKAIGLSTSAIKAVESGHYPLSEKSRALVGAIYGVDPNSLATTNGTAIYREDGVPRPYTRETYQEWLELNKTDKNNATAIIETTTQRVRGLLQTAHTKGTLLPIVRLLDIQLKKLAQTQELTACPKAPPPPKPRPLPLICWVSGPHLPGQRHRLIEESTDYCTNCVKIIVAELRDKYPEHAKEIITNGGQNRHYESNLPAACGHCGQMLSCCVTNGKVHVVINTDADWKRASQQT